NLAGLYHTQENYAEAEPLYRQALQVYKDVLGEKHPAYVSCLGNFAGLYYAQLNYKQAEALCRQILAALQHNQPIRQVEQLQPGDLRSHPTTVAALDNYAILLRDLAKKEQSIERWRACDQVHWLALATLDGVRRQNLDKEEDKVHWTALRFDLFSRRI